MEFYYSQLFLILKKNSIREDPLKHTKISASDLIIIISFTLLGIVKADKLKNVEKTVKSDEELLNIIA